MANFRLSYIEQLFKDNGVVELRILGARPVIGLYDDQDAFLRDARHYWQQGHVYSTLNAPKPRVVANRLGLATALKDKDIGWITRLPFDFDPVRPAGVSSSDVELEEAYSARNRLIDFLSDRGWPEPIRACSGNGFHAQYATRLPNNDQTAQLLRRIYEKLAQAFTTPTVHFDTKVRNPSRVFRLYGTVNRKGLFTEARPHRQSDVLMPSVWAEVAWEQLVALDQYFFSIEVSAELSDSQPVFFDCPGRGDYKTLDVVTWFKHHGCYKRLSAQPGKHYVICPWVFEHSSADSPEKTDSIIFEADGGWPGFYCSHAHCEGRTIRDVLRLWRDADHFCSRTYGGYNAPDGIKER
jgi:hypothetical protein